MQTLVPLSEMQPGQQGIVQSFRGEERQRLRLMELGVLPGTRVRFIRRAPLGDPLEVEIRGFHLSLRAGEASQVALSLV